LGADLGRRLDTLVSMAQTVAGSGAARHEAIKELITAYLLAELSAHGCQLPPEHALDIWETDLELNAQGLEVWLDSRPKS